MQEFGESRRSGFFSGPGVLFFLVGAAFQGRRARGVSGSGLSALSLPPDNRCSKSPQIPGNLHRSSGRGEEMDKHLDPAGGDCGRVGQPEHLLELYGQDGHIAGSVVEGTRLPLGTVRDTGARSSRRRCFSKDKRAWRGGRRSTTASCARVRIPFRKGITQISGVARRCSAERSGQPSSGKTLLIKPTRA